MCASEDNWKNYTQPYTGPKPYTGLGVVMIARRTGAFSADLPSVPSPARVNAAIDEMLAICKRMIAGGVAVEESKELAVTLDTSRERSDPKRVIALAVMINREASKCREIEGSELADCVRRVMPVRETLTSQPRPSAPRIDSSALEGELQEALFS